MLKQYLKWECGEAIEEPKIVSMSFYMQPMIWNNLNYAVAYLEVYDLDIEEESILIMIEEYNG